MKLSRDIQTVLEILQDEVDGDVQNACKKMTSDYTMTWVDTGQAGDELFRTTSTDIKHDMQQVYVIKGRQYDIRNLAEGEDVVFVELIESYPDPQSGKEYRTPLVLVLEMEDGKIKTGRHYLDPRLSYKYLSKEAVEKAYQHSRGSKRIISE